MRRIPMLQHNYKDLPQLGWLQNSQLLLMWEENCDEDWSEPGNLIITQYNDFQIGLQLNHRTLSGNHNELI